MISFSLTRLNSLSLVLENLILFRIHLYHMRNNRYRGKSYDEVSSLNLENG